MCGHSIVAHLLDISTGECYIYASVMLYALMAATFAMSVLYAWYDINCRFSICFMHWASKHPALQAQLARLPGGPSFPCSHASIAAATGKCFWLHPFEVQGRAAHMTCKVLCCCFWQCYICTRSGA